MVILDSPIVNIALPRMQSDLGFTHGTRQWVVTAYSLTFGGLLLLGGRHLVELQVAVDDVLIGHR